MPTNLPARRLYVDDERSESPLQVFLWQCAVLALVLTGLLFSMCAGALQPPNELPGIFMAP
jgi:hypothetical protein